MRKVASAALGADGGLQLGRVDGQLEELLPIHEHNGDPDPVFELQCIVPGDVHVLELEGSTSSDVQNHVARVVAQAAAGTRIHDHPGGRHRSDGRTCRVNDQDRRDLELHRRLKHGDESAFDELYRAYASPAYGMAYRVTGQEALAQEVVHDAFLALWRAPEAYDPSRGHLRTFFLALVHHRAVDTVRREERLRKRGERAANLEPPYDEDVAEDVVQATYLVHRRKEVREALTILPPEQRKVLELAYFGGYTQVQIAEELGIPVGTVKTRTLAAMRKLRRALATEEP
jgi:RNA polymerase sigma factor (sigma-70 family)